MNWILGFIVVLIAIYLINNQADKYRRKEVRKKLKHHWGKPKAESYFDFDLINRFFENHQSSRNSFQVLSNATCNDLDLDAVFKFLDRTASNIGQQYLYSKLRIISGLKELNTFSRLTGIFEQNKSLALRCQVELSRLSSTKTYYLEEVFRAQDRDKSSKIWLYRFTCLAAIISIVSSFFNPTWFLVLIPVFFINLIFHYQNKSSVKYYLNGVAQLSVAYSVAKSLSSSEEIKEFYGNDFGFLQNAKPILSKIRFIKWENKVDNEYALFFWFISEIIKITFNLEPLLFHSFQKSLVHRKEAIKELFCFIGEIDTAISCASLKSNTKKICTPTFKDTKGVISEEIYHPLIENCVANSLRLENSSLLLTGSNMSGKTTFIRTFSINAIIGQTLNFCFAAKFELPYFKIFSAIRISDDLLSNKSYYLEEVVRVKELIDASQKESQCLFVLDELFKGTNTVERIAAGKAILNYLNQKNHIVMVSTHDLELADLLEKHQFDLYHFSETIVDDELSFDHRLKTGNPGSGNALKILGLYDYPEEIILDAKNIEKSTPAHA